MHFTKLNNNRFLFIAKRKIIHYVAAKRVHVIVGGDEEKLGILNGNNRVQSSVLFPNTFAINLIKVISD
jgi:hypothetical protein